MRVIPYLIASILFSTVCWTQNTKFYKAGLDYMEQGNFEMALQALQNDLPSVQSPILLAVAKCYFELNNLEEAENYVKQASVGKNASFNTHLWFGRIAHHRAQFDSAIQHYKAYLKANKETGPEREEVKHLIKQCGNAIKWKLKEQWGYVENLGDKINTKYDEFGPVYSPSFEERIYFSSNRVLSGWDERSKVPYAPTSIYGVEYTNDNWSDIFFMNESFDSKDHNVLLDIDRSGQRAMIFQVIQNKILVDTFSGNTEIKQGVFDQHISPEAGDQYIYMVNDSIILFAGIRPEGFGGLDLYVLLRQHGDWQNPQNLGPQINSPYDEISPYLSPDGSHLFFSSNRPTSIGGYDVFVGKFNSSTNEWEKCNNVYAPINSPGHDISFRIAPSGNSAVFSSNRKDGLGGYDLYTLFFKNPITEIMIEARELQSFYNIAQEGDNFVINEVDKAPLIDFEIPYLLYGNDDFIMTPNNIKKLKNLSTLLNEDSNILVDIICHTDDSQNPEFDLFFSIKRSEKIKDYLVDEGINRERIFIVGAGKSFPIAINKINNVSNPSGQKFNRRIDFRLHDLSNKYKLTYQYPEVVRQFQDTSFFQFNRLRNGLTYKVFVTSSNLPRIPKSIENYPFLMIENINEDSDYDYTVGLLDSYFDANLLKKELRKAGLSDVTVYAYMDGRRLLDQEITFYVSEYPDLVYYQYRSEE